MNKKHSSLLIVVYAITMLTILLCSVFYLLSILKRISTMPPSEKIEYVYISQEPTTPPVEIPDENTDSGWIVKEHNGKIGIFKKNGTLIQTIDTYVKTLPKADQALLGEGFEIQTQSELNSVIEDYSD